MRDLAPSIVPDVARMAVYGHSYAYGYGATDPDRDITTHLASMLKMRELPRAVPGAILHISQQGVTGDGGFGHFLQNDIRPVRPNTTLTAAATANTTTQLTIASSAGMFAGTLLHVGTGDTAAGGGEILYVVTVDDATHVTVKRPDQTTTVARSHASGDPCYVVPGGYIHQTPFYLSWWGINDIPFSPVTSATLALKERFMSPLRATIARMRCSDIFENDHTSCMYSGTGWSPLNGFVAGNSGSSLNQATIANTSVVTIHVPDNFPGGVVDVGWVINSGTATTTIVTFTVDGVAAGTLTFPSNATGLIDAAVKRLTGLSAGRHKVVATLTTLGAGAGVYFDWWGIEATQPPLIIVAGVNRPYSWANYVFNAWPNIPRTTTLNGVHGIGTTSWLVASTASVMVGATVTVESGGTNPETFEILTVPDATHFTTSPSAISHANGVTVLSGAQDADVAKINANIQSVIAEFDANVIYADIESIINRNLAYFYADGLHFNDLGHSILVAYLYSLLQTRISITQAAYTSSPTAPLPSCVTFTSSGGSSGAGVQWLNMPAALTELFGVAAHRKYVDLRRCFEARFVVGVQTAGASGSSLRIQYSIDGGTTWKSLFRTPVYAEDTTHQAVLTTTGMKDSGWKPIAAEALIDNLLLRVVGITGDAVADPTFGTVDCYFR